MKLINTEAYSDFRKLLEHENQYLYESIVNKNMSRKDIVSALNYLMRSTTRCSPYREFSGVHGLSLSDHSTAFSNNDIKVDVKPGKTIENFIIVKNKAIKFMPNSLSFIAGKRIKRIKSQEIIEYFNSLPDEINTITPQVINLLKLGLLVKIKDIDVYNTRKLSSRSLLDFSLQRSEISVHDLNELSKAIASLVFLNSNDVNKSIYWLNDVRVEIFKNYGANPIPILDLFFSEKKIHTDLEELFIRSQSQISIARKAFSDVLSSMDSESQVVLSESHLKILNEASLKLPTNLSQKFGVIFRKISESADKKYQLLYARSSFNGLRVMSEYANDTIITDDEDVIYCDILCQDSLDRGVLLNRPLATNYAISLDGTKLASIQKSIELNDVYVYASHSEIVLYSKKLNKRIVPVLLSSYLSENSSNLIYRFMSAISKFHYNDGVHLDMAWMNKRIYPRVMYEGIVLYPKTWVLDNEAQLRNCIKDLPQFVRVIDGDKDGLVDTSSPYIIDQVMKLSGTRIILQEDFSLSSTVKLKNGQNFVNEIFYSFSLEEKKEKKNFKIYNNRKLPLLSEISEVRLIAGPAMLKDLAEFIIQKYFSGENQIEFYFINYQLPVSHLRFRIFNNSQLAMQIANDSQLNDFFTVRDSLVTHYELETSIYGKDGVDLYLIYSKVMSRNFLKITEVVDSVDLGVDDNFGPVSALLFLGLFSSKVLSSQPSQIIFKEDYLNFSYKRIFNYFLEMSKNNSKFVASVNALVDNLLVEIMPILDSWEALFESGKVDKDLDFFVNRLIHMELFRLTDGSHVFANDFVLKLAADLIKREKYVQI
ncbi:lantibiotic dehydratase, C-terminal domain protein [Bacteriovorax sp. Seq25_V]|nr:lantibiotic dehydratase, C-terminal domain protein [Bacteriovorax sp. Seq25_V]